MNGPAESPEYKRPTDKLSEEHKQMMDKMMKNMNQDQMDHAANHIHNTRDNLAKHSRKAVTFSDFQKAKKVADTDNDEQ